MPKPGKWNSAVGPDVLEGGGVGQARLPARVREHDRAARDAAVAALEAAQVAHLHDGVGVVLGARGDVDHGRRREQLVAVSAPSPGARRR